MRGLLNGEGNVELVPHRQPCCLIPDVSKSISKSFGVLIDDPTDGDFGVALRATAIVDPKGEQPWRERVSVTCECTVITFTCPLRCASLALRQRSPRGPQPRRGAASGPGKGVPKASERMRTRCTTPPTSQCRRSSSPTSMAIRSAPLDGAPGRRRWRQRRRSLRSTLHRQSTLAQAVPRRRSRASS